MFEDQIDSKRFVRSIDRKNIFEIYEAAHPSGRSAGEQEISYSNFICRINRQITLLCITKPEKWNATCSCVSLVRHKIPLCLTFA